MGGQPLEQIYGGTLKGPLRTVFTDMSGKSFAGSTLINSSATLFATVSTPNITSGDLILFGTRTAVASNQVRGIMVDSIVDGVSFALVSDLAPCTGGIYIDWMIFKTT